MVPQLTTDEWKALMDVFTMAKTVNWAAYDQAKAKIIDCARQHRQQQPADGAGADSRP